MRSKFLALFLLIGFFTARAEAATYAVDQDHTSVSFKIKHLFSKVQGQFKKFEGSVDYEAGKPEAWKTSGSIDVESIDTNVPQRDKHLKSADFFDAAKYPTITIDGVRWRTGEGWGLIRASNTQPILVLRFEARTAEGLERIRREADQVLAAEGVRVPSP